MTFEFDGRKYEKASSHQKEWGSKIMTELNLQGDEHVLDLGCGDGILTAQIADLVPQGKVVGIDASRGMIESALPKSRDNLQFLLKDINTLDFADQFDVVFSNATLHWIKDHRRLLENVHRCLRPGGRIRFNFAGDGNCSHFFKVVKEAMAREEYANCFAHFEWPWYMPAVDEYRALVETIGFNHVEVWGENADKSFADEEAMIRWIDQPSLVPFLTYIKAENKEAFRDYVVRRMIEETKQPSGRCFETFRRVNISAVK